jgi:hypothetical protein
MTGTRMLGETINRIHGWVADKPFAQIMYRRLGSKVVLIQTRDGEIGTFNYVADLESGMRFTARL